MISQGVVLGCLLSLSAWSTTFTHINYNCHIHALTGDRIQTLPGVLCIFYSDGSFVSTDGSTMKRLAKDNNVMWSYDGEFHHQLNQSIDGERLLGLSWANFNNDKGEIIKVDRLVILDKQGKVVHETLSNKLLRYSKNSKPYSKTHLTHFNSFHEIPALTNSKVPSYIKQGNYVLNNYGDGVYVLSNDLQQILHYQKFATSDGHYVHDVQVLPNGNYIYFNNLDARSTADNRFSSVQEMNHKGEVVFNFPSKPTPLFFSLHQGGVQKLDDDQYLISSATTATYLYSRKSDKIIRNIYKTHYHNSMFFPLQEARMLDLSSFLGNRK